jgi:DNA polymerase-4
MIPTQLANVLYESGQQLLARELDGTAFRLIGIGVSGISAADGADPVDLIEPGIARRNAAERAMDRVRQKYGKDAVIRGKLYERVKARAARETEKRDQETDDDQPRR